MESFSFFRRLPKRLVWCIYFASAVLGLSVFLTFYYTRDGTYVTTSPNILVSSHLNFNPDRAFVREKLDIDPDRSFTDLNEALLHWSKPGKTSDNFEEKESPPKKTSLSGPDTKYVYLTTASKAVRTEYISKKTTPSPLIPDTCQSTNTSDSKLILIWTSFFGYWNYIHKENFAGCTECGNCRCTQDRTKLNESDAVVFHCRDISVADLPSIRTPHQKWILYCLESPPYSDFPGLQYMENMFNWTMTYRSDSDIISHYGSVTKVRPPRKLDMEYLQWAFNNKSKPVVWMSSHCPTDGGRDKYVAELRKYIDVDTYGTCGDAVCPQTKTQSCMHDFARRYKFFLAFENTICKDYITEKFYRTLQYDVIPVTFGGAKYEKFAPPSSFIDALSFKSPRHLAYFLLGVGKDFKLYSNYFKWKRHYSVSLSNQKECKLCALLHKHGKEYSSYSDMRSWWVTKSHCRSWSPKR